MRDCRGLCVVFAIDNVSMFLENQGARPTASRMPICIFDREIPESEISEATDTPRRLDKPIYCYGSSVGHGMREDPI